MMYLSLSWRNIWRNKKRTIIVAASVFFAVILAVVMRSAQLGSYSYMIHSSAQLFTGYLQIQGAEYWDKRSLDESIIVPESRRDSLKNIPHISHFTRRLEAFALASYKNSTRVTQVIGIDPEVEDEMTDLSEKLQTGSYPEYNSRMILIGSGLAQLLEIHVGDSLVLYGQGYHGQTAAALLPVGGIVKLPFKAMNNGMVLIPLPLAQEVFSTPDRITSLPIMIDDIRHLDQVLADVQDLIQPDQNVMTWDEMMPDLKQNIEVDNASGLIMLAILYIVIAFGVFGTVMMMVSERAREFAILISVGMRKFRLLIVLAIESFFLSFLGVLSGMIMSLPIVFYLVHNPIRLVGEAADIYEQLSIEPILAFSADPVIFSSQTMVVFFIAVFTILYPALFIRKLDPARTIKG